MQAPVLHMQQQQKLWLSADRCLYWEETRSLVLSDLHFGKTGHFRKAGIPIPQTVYRQDLQRLFTQIQYFQPRQLIIVGDLFHSVENEELNFFCKWRNDLSDLQIQLVKGNHDILSRQWYAAAGVEVADPHLTLAPFWFTHDIDYSPIPESTGNAYTFSGHLHPGIRVLGAGKQALRFSCFYFGKSHAVLPAFGGFTGTSLIKPAREEAVYAIVENKILKLQ